MRDGSSGIFEGAGCCIYGLQVQAVLFKVYSKAKPTPSPFPDAPCPKSHKAKLSPRALNTTNQTSGQLHSLDRKTGASVPRCMEVQAVDAASTGLARHRKEKAAEPLNPNSKTQTPKP